MKRREFIAGIGSTAAWPMVARAQQRGMTIIGYLGDQTLETRRDRVSAFHRGLTETGYVDGRDLMIEYRWAEGNYDRLPALATELVRRQVSVIAALGSIGQANAAKAASQTIPIVFSIGGDPVEMGLVGSLNRPGGNITGVTSLTNEVILKRLELLHELVPAANLIALFVNPTSLIQTESETRLAQLAARRLGLRMLVLNVTSESELNGAFITLVQQGAGGLLISGDPLFVARRDHIVALAATYAVPTIYHYREVIEIGGLISYGGDVLEAFGKAGVYTGRILNGERPADLPVQQVTKIELVLNMRTAKSLGITFPLNLLGRADEVIE